MANGVFDTVSSGWTVHYNVSLISSSGGSQDAHACHFQYKSLQTSSGSGDSGRPSEGKMFPRL